MDQVVFFAKGMAIGLAIAAPVGPIGVLCIRRSLNAGMLTGLVSGLGAAVADAVYGAVAGFGLTSVSMFLLDHQAAIRILGGVALLVIGLRILLAKAPAAGEQANANGRLAGAFASCFLLTLTNPTTILSFLAIFAGLGLAEWVRDYTAATVLVRRASRLGALVADPERWRQPRPPPALRGGLRLDQPPLGRRDPALRPARLRVPADLNQDVMLGARGSLAERSFAWPTILRHMGSH
jgi:arginine exporter protein ArgO